jgi:hypothetical protein
MESIPPVLNSPWVSAFTTPPFPIIVSEKYCHWLQKQKRNYFDDTRKSIYSNVSLKKKKQASKLHTEWTVYKYMYFVCAKCIFILVLISHLRITAQPLNPSSIWNNLKNYK